MAEVVRHLTTAANADVGIPQEIIRIWSGIRPSHLAELILEKGKPEKTQGRKATGPRFLRDAACDATKDPKIAGLPKKRPITQFAQEVAMNRLLKQASAAALAAVACAAAPAQAQVFVDCNVGDSIQDALDAQSEAAVASVDFVGTCEEFITIARDRVSIEGVNEEATVVGRVRMFGPSNVTFRNFTITGPSYGVMARGGRTRLLGMTLEGNEGPGIEGYDGAKVSLVGSTVANNGGPHGVVLENAELGLIGSQVYGHPDLGIAVLGNSSLTADGSSVSNNLRGVVAARGSSIRAVNTDITDNIIDGINMTTNSSAELEGVVITRNGGQGVDLSMGAVADIQGGHITDNGESGLYVIRQSSVRLVGTEVYGNAHDGITLINDSMAVLDEHASVPDNLSGFAVRCEGFDSSVEVNDLANVGRIKCLGHMRKWRRHTD